MNNLQEKFKHYSSEDIEAAQDRDFDHWVYDLKNRVQELYDEVMLNNKPTVKRRVALDVSLVEIQVAIENAEKLLKKVR